MVEVAYVFGQALIIGIFSVLFKMAIYGLFGVIGNKAKVPSQAKEIIRQIFLVWLGLGILDGVAEYIPDESLTLTKGLLFLIGAFGLLTFAIWLSYKLRDAKCDKRRTMTMIVYNYFLMVVAIIYFIILLAFPTL